MTRTVSTDVSSQAEATLSSRSHPSTFAQLPIAHAIGSAESWIGRAAWGATLAAMLAAMLASIWRTVLRERLPELMAESR